MMIVFATGGLRFDGRSLERGGLGGSETAVLCMAREMAKRGHSVHVFCKTDGAGVQNDVEYHDINGLYDFNADHHFDVFVCSRFAEIMQRRIRSGMTIFWCHDMLDDPERLKSCLWQVDQVALLSKFQADDYLAKIPQLAPMVYRTRNGVDLELIRANLREKVPGKLIYTSRPERGLLYLLRDIFPKILEQRPDAKLHVCTYDTPGFEIPKAVLDIQAECERLMLRLGESVVRLGSLPKARLYQEISSAEAWVYSCLFPEISCLGAIEAQTCGTTVITTDGYALIETAGKYAHRIAGAPTSESYIGDFVRVVRAVIGNPEESKITLTHDGVAWASSLGYGWDQIASEWEGNIKAHLRRPQTIACCMIVKNEETDILRCLKHVAPFVDEMHFVIDDSSHDGTYAIADEWVSNHCMDGWTVEKAKFDNFAQMRNLSIDDIDTDWILWIDADEVLLGGEHIREYLDTPFFEGYVIRQRHLMLDVPATDDMPIRLFRNRPHYRFTGMVHEHVEDISKGPFDHQIGPAMVIPEVQIAHYGYINETLRREKVSNRNMALLKRSAEEEPERLLTWVFVMRDYLSLARWWTEKNGLIAPGSEQHKMLQAGVEIYLDKFDEMNCLSNDSKQRHAIAYPFYQEILALMSVHKLCCEGRTTPPFEVAFGMVGAPDGVPDAQGIQAKRRWWPDRNSFEQFMADRCAKLIAGVGAQYGDNAPHSTAEHLAGGISKFPQRYAKHGRPLLAAST